MTSRENDLLPNEELQLSRKRQVVRRPLTFTSPSKTSAQVQYECWECCKTPHNYPEHQASVLRFCSFPCIKPWPNGLASRRKMKTWVYLRLRLARACVHLRWLALTWSRSNQSQSQVKSKQVFHRLTTQPKSTQVEWRPSIISQWNTGYVCLEMSFFATCVYLWGSLPVRLATHRVP